MSKNITSPKSIMKHGGSSSQRSLQAAVQQQQSQRSQERVRAIAQAQQPQQKMRSPEIIAHTSIRGKAGIIQQQSQGIRRPNLNSNVETGCIQKRPTDKSQNRSPYDKTRNPVNIHANSNLNDTPTQNENRSSYQNMQTAFSTKNFSIRESNDSLRSSAILKTSMPNGLPSQGSTNASQVRTQRHLQKSVENLQSHKTASSKSREKHLRNQAQNSNVNASSNFPQYQNQISHGQSSSKTQRQWGDHVTRHQQLRASAESHVSGTSGISGILGNTQITAGASVSVLQAQNSNQKQQTQIIDVNERNSDEIIIGSTVLRQPKQAFKIQNQQIYHIQTQESEIERNYGNRGSHQQSQSSASALLQSYEGEKRHHNIMSSASYEFNNGGSHKNNQSTFSNQLQLISSSLQNKVCNSIEEAQPILRLCLNNVGHNTVNMTQVTQGANQFTSILSDNEIDQNLVCPACKFIVVNPVECQSCQYIICHQCSIKSNSQCQEESCREMFTSQPGKIHKLYRAMLNQLEFRCPNHGAGCQEILKYDQLDEHLKEECESRDQICPNQCSMVKMPACQIKEHLQTICPKVPVKCPECQIQVQRGFLQNHLENECERVQIKCEKCDQFDFRINFQTGKHDCISLLKNAISKIQENTERTEGEEDVPSTARLRSGDQRPRALDDFKQNIENNQTKSQAHEIDILNRQVQNLKVDMQNLDTIVTDDIFRMFDNMSLCVTQKDDEVKQLVKKVSALEEGQKVQQEAMSSQQTEFEGLLAALDLKYQETIDQMQRNQKSEIENMKRTLLQELEANIADQLATHSSLTHQSNRIPLREEQKIGNYHSLRNSGGKRKSGGHQKVPSLNFGKQAVQDIGFEGQNQLYQPINPGNYPPPLSQRNISRGSGVRSNKQSQDNQEEEDFVPFLSSTDNELTDLNTEFNTDRPLYAESSGPQSTYRSKPKKNSQIPTNQRSSNVQPAALTIQQRGTSAYASLQPPKRQTEQLEQEEYKRADSQRAYQQQSNAPQIQEAQGYQEVQHESQLKDKNDLRKMMVQKTGSSDRIGQGSQKQLDIHPQRTSGMNADMSFDNESVTNHNQVDKGQSPMSQKSQDQNDSFTNTDVEDTNDPNLQQRIQQPQQNNDNMLIQDCVQAEQYFEPMAPPNTQQEGQAYFSQQSRQIDQMQQEGDKYQSKTEARSQDKKSQKYASNNKSHQSNQFVSILDESSDLEQINNHQLPGSIHGGMTNSSGFGSHLQSQHSNQSTINASRINQNQSQFSALSRGQLFGANNGPSSRNDSNEFSQGPIGFSGKTGGLESALITDRQMSGDRNNQLAMHQSLESLDAFQVNLDKNVLQKTISENSNPEVKQKQDTHYNQYKQQKVQQDKPCSRMVEEQKEKADGDVEAYQNLEQLIQSASSTNRVIQEAKTTEQQDNELVQNLKQETQNMIDQIKLQNKDQVIEQNALQQFENQVNAMGIQKQISESIQSRRSGIGEDTDLEGNETENEQIKEHLDHLEAIDADKQEGGGIHSALRGLESDLETIFETDMESNYVTTARTNLSTKKLLNQLAQNHPNQDQEKLTQILMSQFSPIARSGHGSQSHNSHSNFKRKGGSSSKKEYNTNFIPSQVVANSKQNNHLNLQQKQLDFDDVVSPDGGNGTGTDTSQSCLISARSHNRQEVHNTQMKNQPGIENVNLGPENYVEKGQTKIQQPHGQCFLTHKELEKLGSKQSQQSQLDRDERRIRVFSDKQTSHAAQKSAEKKPHNLREGPSTLSPRALEQKDQHQSLNNHLSNFLTNQEIIQEEDIETEGEDLQQTGQTVQQLHPQKIQSTLSSAHEQIQEFLGHQDSTDGTTVDILKGIRQNLKDKFQNQDVITDQDDQDFANAQAQMDSQSIPRNADLIVQNNQQRDSSRSFENEEDEYDDNQGNFQFK